MKALKHLSAVAALFVMALALAPAASARDAFVTNSSGGNLSRLNTSTQQLQHFNELSGRLGSTVRPEAVAITPDGSRAYVTVGYSNSNLGHVAVVNTTSNEVVEVIPVGLSPEGIALTPDGGKAYVANSGSNDVTVIRTADNSVVGSAIPVETHPTGIAVTPDGGHVYVTNFDSGSVSIIKTSTPEVEKTLPVGPRPFDVAITPDGSRAYVSAGTPGFIYVIDTTSMTVVRQIAAVHALRGIAISSDGSRAYAPLYGYTGSVAVDLATNKITTIRPSIEGYRYAWGTGMAITPDGSRAYATLMMGDSIAQINTASNTFIEPPLWAGSTPTHIAIVPNQGPTVAQLAVTAGQAGEPTSFEAQGTTDSDGTVASYKWDFGDGSPVATTTDPTTTYTYTPDLASRSYTATVTVTDNEGGSTADIGDGRTLSHHGNPGAQRSVSITVPATPTEPVDGGPGSTTATPAGEQGAAGQECTSALKSQPVSVGHWLSFAGGFSRIVTAPGAHSGAPIDLTLQTRKAGRGSASLRRVVFTFDGDVIGTDSRSPYRATAPAAATGRHRAAATIYSRGKRRTLALSVYVLPCEPSAFSVGMTGKVRNSRTNVLLRAQTANQKPLAKATFSLARQLSVRPRGAVGKRIAKLRLLDASGNTKLSRSLTLKRAAHGRFALVGKGGGPTVTLARTGSRYTISLAGLDSYQAPRIKLTLLGRGNGFLRNAPICRRYVYSTQITTIDGSADKLTRGLAMCKGRARQG